MSWNLQIYSPSSKPGDENIEFITSNGLKYTVLFVSAKDYFSDYPEWRHTIASVIFDCSGKPVHDEKVMGTICVWLHTVMDHKFFSLLWVCSADDQKHHARYRLFGRYWRKYEDWVENSNSQNVPAWNFAKYDNIIYGEGETYYSSLVIHNDNPNKAEILKAFNEEAQNLSKD